MSVILSIKPKYCEEISKGRKKYEFRKRAFSQDVKYVFMYSTSPVKCIVGIFRVESIIEDTPEKLWDYCKDFSGISERKFFEYFRNSERGVAIKIDEVKMFKPLDPKILFPDFSPPQSYVYIKELWFCLSQIRNTNNEKNA